MIFIMFCLQALTFHIYYNKSALFESKLVLCDTWVFACIFDFCICYPQVVTSLTAFIQNMSI